MQALVFHHLKAEEIPSEWAKQLPAGQRFTITITAEKPQQNYTEEIEEPPPLFGIWKDNAATKDVDAYVRELRKGRFHVD